jgi:two-component system, OmpR family, heavy metal sensor histidine kinase CusS
MNLSIASRLIGFFTLISLLVLVLLGGLLAHAVQHHFDEMDLAELQTKQQQIRLYTENNQLGQAELIAQLNHLLPREAGWHYLLFDQQGLLFSSPDSPHAFSLQEFSANQLQRFSLENQTYVSWFSTPADNQAWSVISLKNIDHHEHFIQMFIQLLLAGSLIALLVMVGLGWWMVRQGLEPLRHLSQLATKVSGQNLTDRLSPSKLPAELQPLAETFNAMLDRLEAAFSRLNQFSADLAHEFRTPINNLMMQSQVALSQTRDAQAYQDVLVSNIEEFERLARMVNDMLLLAKTEQDPAMETQSVSLRPLCQQLIEYFELPATERQIGFSLQGEAQVQGNAALLRRALANILANAVRHAESQSAIQIQLNQAQDQVQIAICNQGDTLPADQLDQLFERFYRAESARPHQGGSGLGLAITRAIVQAHQGRIEATSQANQTCFVIHLNLRQQ